MPDYDVLIAGGSVSGLLAAREIGSRRSISCSDLRKTQRLALQSTAGD